MTTEDLQEKYRDKHKELKPSVPLAADSAHLLTEYLDSVSVEFVKQGVMEPYRITRELEEILVGELQQQGSKNKLTYEVTSKVLEKYGSPVQVVARYIKENKPKLHPILVPAEPDTPSTSESDWLSQLKNDPALPVLLQGITWIILLLTILLEGTFLLSILTGYELSYLHPDDFVFLSQIFVPFLFLEIITGRKGHVIELKYYHTLRETVRFLISSITLVGIMWFVNIYSLNAFPRILVPWILVYGVGLLKDHTDLLQSSSLRQKPVARFVLPSYLISGLAYVVALFVLYSQNNYVNPAKYVGPNWRVHQTDQGLVAFVLFLSIFSIVLDLKRKYPLSLKKLAYNIIFYYFIYFINSFKLEYFVAPNYYWKIEIMTNFPVILSVTTAYTIALAVVIPLLFRREIKVQLAEYRESLQRSLDDYRQ